MDQKLKLEDILLLFEREDIIELYTKGNELPWYANRVRTLLSVLDMDKEYTADIIPMDRFKISSKFAGYDKSHVVVVFDDELNISKHRDDWWDRLRLATTDEISELVESIIRKFIYQKIKDSCNEVALSALESGKCDKVLKEAVSQIDLDSIMMVGITNLDIINARSNPSDSEIHKAVVKAIENAMQGEAGEAFMHILFG